MAHTELDLRERRTIEDMLNAKVPVSEIAAEIGRHRSTVYREIKRNYFTDEELPELNGYYGMSAQKYASDRRARRRKLIRLNGLRAHVIAQLKIGWTPEQIAGRLDFDGQPIRVSHETIYAYVYSREGQSEQLARHLPSRRKKRQPRYSRRPRGQVFPPDRSIHERPGCVKTRETFGDWEGDLMIFERSQGTMNVASLVERKTRFAVLFRNNDRSPTHFINKLMDVMEPLPQPARKSITFDRGFEFRAWRKLKSGIGTDSWFCDPQAPWQKGSVENLNKRARRYLPRDTQLAALSNRNMRAICERLNGTRGLVGKYVDVYEMPDGRIQVRAKGVALPCSIFDPHQQRVTHAAITENKHLSAVLAHIKEEQQKSAPPPKVKPVSAKNGYKKTGRRPPGRPSKMEAYYERRRAERAAEAATASKS